MFSHYKEYKQVCRYLLFHFFYHSIKDHLALSLTFLQDGGNFLELHVLPDSHHQDIPLTCRQILQVSLQGFEIVPVNGIDFHIFFRWDIPDIFQGQ
jgi:hypothetical protein